MCVAAGLLVMGACASAMLPADAQIMIDRALNSPTLTVRYNGARVALVELKLNGESLGTRAVSSTKASGETTFTIDLSNLKDGANKVEVRLFDRTGKLVGSDKTNILTDNDDANAPVRLITPKMGASVMGPVEISVGFGKDLKDTYVSFFIDDDFKSMTNFPPYTYLWDTARETNGWHEVQAMVVDGTSDSFKTRKVRIFVNNPGGRTDRPGTGTADVAPIKNPLHANVIGEGSGLRTMNVKSSSVVAKSNVTHLTPGVSAAIVTNKVRTHQIGSMVDTKPVPTANLAVTGVRNLAPTAHHAAPVVAKVKPVATKTATVAATKPTNSIIVIQKVATAKVASNLKVQRVAMPNVNQVTTAATLLPITKGQKIPNLATFAVILNDQFVNFDVQPRVDSGVPMTPFRHLIEKAGGKVDWQNMTKTVNAQAEGHKIFLQIGDANAKINDLSVSLEVAPYIDRGRTIVPLSFMRDALNVNVEFDKTTGHVLITSLKK